MVNFGQKIYIYGYFIVLTWKTIDSERIRALLKDRDSGRQKRTASDLNQANVDVLRASGITY